MQILSDRRSGLAMTVNYIPYKFSTSPFFPVDIPFEMYEKFIVACWDPATRLLIYCSRRTLALRYFNNQVEFRFTLLIFPQIYLFMSLFFVCRLLQKLVQPIESKRVPVN